MLPQDRGRELARSIFGRRKKLPQALPARERKQKSVSSFVRCHSSQEHARERSACFRSQPVRVVPEPKYLQSRRSRLQCPEILSERPAQKRLLHSGYFRALFATHRPQPPPLASVQARSSFPNLQHVHRQE